MLLRSATLAVFCFAGFMFAQGNGDWDERFLPYNVIGNVYYVGTKGLASFLITTPDGNILINSDVERNVPTIRESVEKLGFRFRDTTILLGSHAHNDHMEGEAMVKELTGALVMAMAEDVLALEKMRPGNKPHPINRVLHDGDQVTLGSTTLVAHRTPGHTKGCTTWTMKVQDSGKTYYSQEEVREIVEFAHERGIRVVPEFDIPGHATSWFAGFPELASAPGPYAIQPHRGPFELTMDPTRQEVYDFLDVFFGEVAALFPDEYVHIGETKSIPLSGAVAPPFKTSCGTTL